MNSQNTQAHQATLIELENAPQDGAHELSANFKANGFWQVQGQKRAGTLRRKGEGPPTAYFIVSHPNGEPPFNEPTEVEFQTRGGLALKGWVKEHWAKKDVGEQSVCSEYDPDGKRCERRRFWKTLCEVHTKAAGFIITNDGRLCLGQKQNGEPCTYRAKVNGYCAQHGGGSAPPESKSFLYEFPIEIIRMVEEREDLSRR